MQRDVDTLVLNAVNTCWRVPITLPVLLHILREQQPPGEWRGQILQFFQDVPVGAIHRFCSKHGLSVAELRHYYETFLVPLGQRSPELEEWLYGGVGASV